MAKKNSDIDDDDDDDCTVLSVDIEECRDLMLSCAMARLEALGWKQDEARRVCDKAINMMIARVPDKLGRMTEICGSAARSGAPGKVVNMLAKTVFAIGGVEIADDLNKSRIASMN